MLFSSIIINRRSKLFLEVLTLLVFGGLIAAAARGVSPVAQTSRDSSGLAAVGKLATELTVFRAEAAFPGFTLYPVDGTGEVELLNLSGQVVHRWPVDVERARLLPNGNLLAVHGSKWGRRKKPWRKLRDTIIEYDWSGKRVWSFEAKDVVHHDVRRLPNGNTVFLRRTIVPRKYQKKIRDSVRRTQKIRSDSIIEVDRTGQVVWQWHAHEHLDLNECGKRGCNYLAGQANASDKGKDWTHINTAFVLPANKWFKSGDLRFRPGNIAVLPRNWWTALIVDRVSGDIVWEYTGDYRGGLGGGHEVHMIAEGFPGAGNMLIFDNGASVHPKESIILEINPVTKEVVWKYEAKDFFSASRGSAQRLKNGNTLISEDVRGRVFEVNSQGETVWEFRGKYPINRAHRYSQKFAPQLAQLPLR